MNQNFYIAPVGFRVGLTSICLGLVHALDRKGVRVTFFKPIAQLYEGDVGPERSTHLIRSLTSLNPPDPIDIKHAEELVNEGSMAVLMEEIMELYHVAAADADVVIIEGLHPTGQDKHAEQINAAIADALDSLIIFVGASKGNQLEALNEQFKLSASYYGGTSSGKVLGGIVNFINAPRDENGRIRPDLNIVQTDNLLSVYDFQTGCDVFSNGQFKLIGGIPWRPELVAPRVSDIAEHLGGQFIHEGEKSQRRVRRVFMCARSVDHVTHVFQADALLLIPTDRADLLIAACMACMNDIKLAGIVITSGPSVDQKVMNLCKKALDSGLPILTVPYDSYTTATMIPRMNLEVPIDDTQRINQSMDYMASMIDGDWLKEKCTLEREPRLSPAAFKHQLVSRSRDASKRIVLPEGEEPRTIKAAATCQQRGIAQCVLLGDPVKVKEIAQAQGINLPQDIEILDPVALRGELLDPLLELRKHKNLTRVIAESHLEDNVYVGTMMVQQGMVDGLVSGAVHTTANTIRPALQLIRTRPGSNLVSSIFFMCLPDHVVLYGDCAINPDPNAEQLADIALQSADSAAAFGLPVRVAMISYSTGESGTGDDVDKVREATRLAQERRPDLLIDGPLQYDAAANMDVARSKAPDSPVAGKATVFIFPDLNTGNTTYKAVQRNAQIVSIGPMIQGLNAPVNDLSRGAMVEDIVYTIAITAIQAAGQE